jgi:hypothetical protein
MPPRMLAFVALGVFALGSGGAMAQGHAGGYQNGAGPGRAVAYHDTRYRYRHGGWGGYHPGVYGYRAWYGPSVGVYVGVPSYTPSGVWGYPSDPNAVYDASAPSQYPADAPAPPGSFMPPGPEQAPVPSGYWYYCTDPAGYYPDVEQCNSTWTPVAPQGVTPGQ